MKLLLILFKWNFIFNLCPIGITEHEINLLCKYTGFDKGTFKETFFQSSNEIYFYFQLSCLMNVTKLENCKISYGCPLQTFPQFIQCTRNKYSIS